MTAVVYTVVVYSNRTKADGGNYAMYVGHHHEGARSCNFCGLTRCATPDECSMKDLAVRVEEYGPDPRLIAERKVHRFKASPVDFLRLYRKANAKLRTELSLQW